MTGIIDRSKYNYERKQYADPETGKRRSTYSNGDAVANAMLGLSADQLEKVMKDNGLEEKLGKHLTGAANPGQFRMLLGNSLRAKVKRGEPVTIGEHTVKKLDQKVKPSVAPPPPKVAPTPPKAKEKAEKPAKAKKAA